MITLLDLVSDDGQPDFYVNSMSKWFEENQDEFILALVLGFIAGVIVTCFIYEMIKIIKSPKESKSDHNQNKEN